MNTLPRVYGHPENTTEPFYAEIYCAIGNHVNTGRFVEVPVEQLPSHEFVNLMCCESCAKKIAQHMVNHVMREQRNNGFVDRIREHYNLQVMSMDPTVKRSLMEFRETLLNRPINGDTGKPIAPKAGIDPAKPGSDKTVYTDGKHHYQAVPHKHMLQSIWDFFKGKPDEDQGEGGMGVKK